MSIRRAARGLCALLTCLLASACVTSRTATRPSDAILVAATTQPHATQALELAKAATVKILVHNLDGGPGIQGSGFVSGGKVVTAAHVIAKAVAHRSLILLEGADGAVIGRAQLAWGDPRVLAAAPLLSDLERDQMNSWFLLDDVAILEPMDEGGRRNLGMLPSLAVAEGQPKGKVLIGAADTLVEPGASGGPAIDAAGCVVGVITGLIEFDHTPESSPGKVKVGLASMFGGGNGFDQGAAGMPRCQPETAGAFNVAVAGFPGGRPQSGLDTMAVTRTSYRDGLWFALPGGRIAMPGTAQFRGNIVEASLTTGSAAPR